MKLLAEALALRSSLNLKLGDLRKRIQANIYITTGNDAYEDATTLLAQALTLSSELEILVNRINQTNNKTKFTSNIFEGTIAGAIAHRDTLSAQIKTISETLEAIPNSKRGFFDERSTGKVTMSVSELRTLKDEYSSKLRKLDVEIQKTNWSTNL